MHDFGMASAIAYHDPNQIKKLARDGGVREIDLDKLPPMLRPVYQDQG